MIFNCIKCGKSISSKADVCVYCKSDISQFAVDFDSYRKDPSLKTVVREKFLKEKYLKEKYAGTFLSLLFKTKVNK